MLTTTLATMLLVGAVAPAGAQPAIGGDHSRAAWLLERSGLEASLVTGEPLNQSGIGGTQYTEESSSGGGAGAGLTMLMSAVLPGLGEATMGYSRGYFMMALDVFVWTRVIHYNNEGNDAKTEYRTYAEAHWSEDKFRDAYQGTPDDEYLQGVNGGIGLDYYVDVEPGGLPALFVPRDEDEREWFENLGKWDQFVFGWDDFRRPDDPPLGIEYDVTGGVIDLQQPWISANRETYRLMREESNDAFEKRDRLIYVNIGLRVFSVLQVAYLQGLFGGGPTNELLVAGHKVEIIAEPRGFTSSRLGAIVSF